MSTETSEDQLGWERRAGRPAAAAAIAAGVLPLIAGILLAPSLPITEDPEAGFVPRLLLGADERPAVVIGLQVVTALGIAALAPAVGYLVRATRARSDRVPRIVGPLLMATAIGLAAVLLLERVLLVDVAQGFAETDQTDEAANDVLRGGAASTASLIGLALSVGLGAAIVITSLQAMRAGLLSRFMGVIGLIAGALFALPQLRSLGLPLQVYWLVALGFLYLGRWPGGRGPAWDRVEALPWPTAAERAEQDREERVAKAQREAYGEEGGAGTGSGGDGAGAGADEPAQPRPASRKKRRGR